MLLGIGIAAFVAIGLPIFQLVLRASLGVVATLVAGGVALAFTAVAAIVLYMVAQMVFDKLRGW
jgi:hypothetical protein